MSRQTALDMAKRKDHKDIVKLLEDTEKQQSLQKGTDFSKFSMFYKKCFSKNMASDSSV